MAKVGIVLLADTETPGDMGRMANALTTAQEFKEAGDPVRVIFDGAGTKWPVALADPEHKYHRALERVRDVVDGACEYCARAYGVHDKMESTGVPLLGEFRDHPSLKSLVDDGYQIITF